MLLVCLSQSVVVGVARFRIECNPQLDMSRHHRIQRRKLHVPNAEHSCDCASVSVVGVGRASVYVQVLAYVTDEESGQKSEGTAKDCPAGLDSTIVLVQGPSMVQLYCRLELFEKCESTREVRHTTHLHPKSLRWVLLVVPCEGCGLGWGEQGARCWITCVCSKRCSLSHPPRAAMCR